MQVTVNILAEQEQMIIAAAARHRANHAPHAKITDMEFLALRLDEFVAELVARELREKIDAAKQAIEAGEIAPDFVLVNLVPKATVVKAVKA